MAGSFLSQEEIDALLQQQVDVPEETSPAPNRQPLTEAEKDTLGEIGNISMGTAATTLSQILNQRVTITTPQVAVTTMKEVTAGFTTPCVMIEVNFIKGLEGSNLFVVQVPDALIIADLMMGGDGTNPQTELGELHLSAISEAMNQMIGSASTSMSSLFNKVINISPPKVTPLEVGSDGAGQPYPSDDAVVTVSFRMQIGSLIDSQFVQIMPEKVAKEEAGFLLHPAGQTPSPDSVTVAQAPPPPVSAPPAAPVAPKIEPKIEPVRPELSSAQKSVAVASARNIDLILDVPLQISVVLGRTKKPIKEVLGMGLGSIVELEKLADEPVDILVNGTLIAHGEVVVINENFGVRITSIATPMERLNNLRN